MDDDEALKNCGCGCAGILFFVFVCVPVATSVWEWGSGVVNGMRSRYEARVAQRQAEDAKKAEQERLQKQAAEEKRRREEVAAEEKRRREEMESEARRRRQSKDEKIRSFALKEAPKVWAVYQALKGEIEVQGEKIAELKATLATFGREPEEDGDFKRICTLRDEMIQSCKALRMKLEDAYIAARKYEAAPSRKDYQELHRKALDDGIPEADAAAARFKEMRISK